MKEQLLKQIANKSHFKYSYSLVNGVKFITFEPLDITFNHVTRHCGTDQERLEAFSYFIVTLMS